MWGMQVRRVRGGDARVSEHTHTERHVTAWRAMQTASHLTRALEARKARTWNVREPYSLSQPKEGQSAGLPSVTSPASTAEGEGRWGRGTGGRLSNAGLGGEAAAGTAPKLRLPAPTPTSGRTRNQLVLRRRTCSVHHTGVVGRPLRRAAQQACGQLAHEDGGGLDVDALVLKAHENCPGRAGLWWVVGWNRGLGGMDDEGFRGPSQAALKGNPASPSTAENRELQERWLKSGTTARPRSVPFTHPGDGQGVEGGVRLDGAPHGIIHGAAVLVDLPDAGPQHVVLGQVVPGHLCLWGGWWGGRVHVYRV